MTLRRNPKITPTHTSEAVRIWGVRLLVWGAISLALGIGMAKERGWNAQKQAYLTRVSHISVAWPGVPPLPSQGDIETALHLFSIQIPKNVKVIRFDPLLEDRGLTVGMGFSPVKTITIGPSAFSSWALLGSTLRHEVEIHGRQSFAKVTLLNLMGQWAVEARKVCRGRCARWSGLDALPQSPDWGTAQAEREAYFGELNAGVRFGLNAQERASIFDVVQTFYFSDAPTGLAVKNLNR